MRFRSRSTAAAMAAFTFLCASTALADPLGRTTLEETIRGGERFSFLGAGPGSPYVVRDELGAAPRAGRAADRRSLAYFVQLTDFQLADEESPVRVEFTDDYNAFFYSAWRPQEALNPHMIDATLRQVNAHMRSPVTGAGGERAKLGFAVMTGDNADNQQLNETDWVVTLLRGGLLNPNSGSTNPDDYADCPPGTPGPEEAVKYTGVQDYDDYVENGDFYDPDVPAGDFANWPAYPGLMDKAQQPFMAAGLKVPTYVAFGNHDALVQGNEDANSEYQRIGTGCTKVLQGTPLGLFDGALLAGMLGSDPSKVTHVPPDPSRRFVTKPEYKRRFKDGPHGYGFSFVDPAEEQASRGAAGYYSFSPAPGFRFIALDTVSEGGQAGCSHDGNIDNSQWLWLEKELAKASAADELVVLFAHHSIQSLTCQVSDEEAVPCGGPDENGNDRQPGCDHDPRPSQPVRFGEDLTALLHKHPHAIAFVAGHSHVNDVVGFKREIGGGFWNLRTSAEVDWPTQQRLIEVMDNRDGTLSIFGTLIDSGAPIVAAPGGTAAAGFTVDQIATIGRTLAYNEPHHGFPEGVGDPKEDHNVELLIADPRRAPGAFAKPSGTVRLKVKATPRRLRVGRRTRVTFKVTAGGRPVRGATVAIGRRKVRTNAKGVARLALKARRRGTLRVRVTAKGLKAASLRLRVAR